MYSRSPRFNSSYLPTGASPTTVGPGAYDIDSEPRSAEHGYAPFLSLTSRMPRGASEPSPGPAQYNSEISKRHIKGCRAMQSTAKRFSRAKGGTLDNPAPGDYDIPSTIKTGQKPLCRPHNTRHKNPHQHSVPSIPSATGCMYYDLDDDDRILPLPTSAQYKLPGPGLYDVSQCQDAYATRAYKGNHWSKSAAKRFKYGSDDGMPAPNAYGVALSTLRVADPVAYEDRPLLQVPRFTEKLVLDAYREKFPGPGAYDVGEEDSPRLMRQNAATAFGTRATRFPAIQSFSQPGPGQYDTIQYFEGAEELPALKKVPFLISAPRFERFRSSSAPDPTSYRTENVIRALNVTPKYKGTPKAPFNTTSERKPTKVLVCADAFASPGPAMYDVPSPRIVQKLPPTKSSAFSSRTGRAYDAETKDKRLVTPAPCVYNAGEAYERSHGRRSHHRGKDPFRLYSGRGDYFTLNANPGPGEYELSAERPRVEGEKRGTQFGVGGRRFAWNGTCSPGPGHYQLSPAIQDSMLRKTFNVTLDNPEPEWRYVHFCDKSPSQIQILNNRAR